MTIPAYAEEIGSRLPSGFWGVSGGRLLDDVLRQGNTNGLEDITDLTSDMRTGGNVIAVLLDGGLLEAIELIEEQLPFRRQPFRLAQAGQFLGLCQLEEPTKHVPADGSIQQMPDPAGIEAGFRHARQPYTQATA